MSAVATPINSIVSARVCRRPIRSPMCPKTSPPTGRITKPTAKVTKLSIVPTRELVSGKKSLLNTIDAAVE
jgi:hypothetical protein